MSNAMALCKFRNAERFSMTNKQSAEHIAPRLLRNMAFLKLRKNIAFQNVLRVSKNVSPVNPVLNRVAQDVELC